MTADRTGSMACAFTVCFTARRRGIRRRSENRLDGSLPGIRKPVLAPKAGDAVAARLCRAAPAGVRYRADEGDAAGAESRLIADRNISTAPSESPCAQDGDVATSVLLTLLTGQPDLLRGASRHPRSRFRAALYASRFSSLIVVSALVSLPTCAIGAFRRAWLAAR